MDKKTQKGLQNLFVDALMEAKTFHEQEQPVKEDEQMKKITKKLKICGVELDSKYYPVLSRLIKENPKWIEKQVRSVADAWHEGSVESALPALESDLEHSGA